MRRKRGWVGSLAFPCTPETTLNNPRRTRGRAPSPSSHNSNTSRPILLPPMVNSVQLATAPSEQERDGQDQGRRSLRAKMRVSYDEGQYDIDLPSEDMGAADRPTKRPRSVAISDSKKRHMSEAELETRTAWAVGLNGIALSEGEHNLLPPGTNEGAYIKVRNHVLAKWRADVSQWLTEEQAASKIMPKFRYLVSAAWRFLTQHGYINFGVAPAITETMLKATDSKGTVIIIGAGLAGLAAARQLRAMGHRVVVLEGRDRLGGRVYTKRIEADGVAAVADLGGSVISGIDGNPLAVLAKQLCIPLHQINDDTPFYFSDGSKVQQQIDHEAEEAYNSMLDSCGHIREHLGQISDNISLGTALQMFWEQSEDKRPLKKQLIDWHFANLEFANASTLDTLSLRGWDQDDPYELMGSHIFLPGCNLRLVAALAEGTPVFFNSTVNTVQYSENGVAVHTDNAVFKGDAVCVTVPLGVLKRDLVKFDPPLNARKKGAINRLGFGVLNKVVLLFPDVFWGDKNDMFGHVNEHADARGKYFLFYSYAHISGGAVLIALVAGKAAVKFEDMDTGAVVDEVMGLLRKIYEPKGTTVPPPLQAICTRWAKDPLSFGSYSSVAVGSPGSEDYDIMAESIAGRVFFAGEATTRKYPATMHGAFMSGLREAANIASTLHKNRLENGVQNGVDVKMEVKVEGDGKNMEMEIDKDNVQVSQTTGKLVKKLFDTHVDSEFGCFSAVFGENDGPSSDQALLKVDLGKLRKGVTWSQLPLFACVSKTDIDTMKELEGGDQAKLLYLVREKGIQLVGRGGNNGLSSKLIENFARSKGLLA